MSFSMLNFSFKQSNTCWHVAYRATRCGTSASANEGYSALGIQCTVHVLVQCNLLCILRRTLGRVEHEKAGVRVPARRSRSRPAASLRSCRRSWWLPSARWPFVCFSNGARGDAQMVQVIRTANLRLSFYFQVHCAIISLAIIRSD